jgi:ubiquinone/menaquinone biosynthesis C-methylase UbiE
MKVSTQATTYAILASPLFMLANAFLAPSQKYGDAVAWAGDAVSPLMAKPKKNDKLAAKPAFAERHATTRKKWGVEVDESEYWDDPRIHTLGNSGLGGAIHAAMAPISTFVIDSLSYKGTDIRHLVADELASIIHLNQGRILDLCCGVGMSTRALQDAFPNAEQIIGVDTSSEMIAMAKAIDIQDTIFKPFTSFAKTALNKLDSSLQRQYNAMHHKSMKITKAASNKIVQACSHISFATQNAEHTTFESNSFDLITIMYGFHEIPRKGRDTILREARRLLRKGGILALIDISPDYEPSNRMLSGEPYVKEYQTTIDKQVRKFVGFKEWEKTLLPGHVKMWMLQRT